MIRVNSAKHYHSKNSTTNVPAAYASASRLKLAWGKNKNRNRSNLDWARNHPKFRLRYLSRSSIISRPGANRPPEFVQLNAPMTMRSGVDGIDRAPRGSVALAIKPVTKDRRDRGPPRLMCPGKTWLQAFCLYSQNRIKLFYIAACFPFANSPHRYEECVSRLE